MKKILLGIFGALIGFVLLVVAFSVVFLLTAEEDQLVEEEAGPGAVEEIDMERRIPYKELYVIIQERDSLQVDADSLQALLAQSAAKVDSLQRLMRLNNATVSTLEQRMQEKDAEIKTLRTVEVNAREMARTFATMSVGELTPIVAMLVEDVVLDIYKHTATKKRKNLLAALGDERAAALTTRLVKQEGS